MGIRLFSTDSYSGPPLPLPNPNPARYTIKENVKIGDMLVVKIHYTDCTNYEGDKVLVYMDVTLEDLKSQKLIDPHFSENKEFASPVARFEPTDRGWNMAVAFSWAWSKGKLYG